MIFQKNVKNYWKDSYNKLSKLNQLITRSNLLGSDLKVTNFGGGNTSSKIQVKDPITKKMETILYVKGSGGDLGSIKEDGFASLYLDKFNSLKNIYRGFNFEDEIRHQDLAPKHQLSEWRDLPAAAQNRVEAGSKRQKRYAPACSNDART